MKNSTQQIKTDHLLILKAQNNKHIFDLPNPLTSRTELYTCPDLA